jgi:hypothetical protein
MIQMPSHEFVIQRGDGYGTGMGRVIATTLGCAPEAALGLAYQGGVTNSLTVALKAMVPASLTAGLEKL